MIERSAGYYTTGFDGALAEDAPFFRHAVEFFDGSPGDLNAALIEEYNRTIEQKDGLRGLGLPPGGALQGRIPRRIVIINASGDDLPTSYETARVFRRRLEQLGVNVEIGIVNTPREMAREKETSRDTLFVSQCVNRDVYDIETARTIEASGGIVVPGVITAPGGVFSDKARTYELLSDGGRDWGMVARYVKVDPRERSAEALAEGILDSVEEMARLTGEDTFFIKPHEGGGGLGGFRITRSDGRYYIPDLSKVTGRAGSVHPTYLDLDVKDDAKMREVLSIYRLFAGDPVLRANYLRVELPVEGSEDALIERMRDYLLSGALKRGEKVRDMLMDRRAAIDVLSEAIGVFQKKFGRPYVPLVNEHLDFGLWGLRAHYRISSSGLRLETIYHRIFQLAFTPEGIGYLGSDNISNKQTGDLEIMRLGPIDGIMLEAIGGKQALFETLDKGAKALVKLRATAEGEERERLPLRLQLDLAALSRKIGEGNADTARGLCLASRWAHFVENTEGWLDDSLAYYAWRSSREAV